MKTLVLGASINPERASHKCVVLLEQAGYQVVAIGLRPGLIGNQQIKTEYTNFEGIHTISLYLGPKNQTEEIHNFIISLNPERVIFNPGTENPAFIESLRSSGIHTEISCALVLLSTGQY